MECRLDEGADIIMVGNQTRLLRRCMGKEIIDSERDSAWPYKRGVTRLRVLHREVGRTGSD
jgi:hypothetical protein